MVVKELGLEGGEGGGELGEALAGLLEGFYVGGGEVGHCLCLFIFLGGFFWGGGGVGVVGRGRESVDDWGGRTKASSGIEVKLRRRRDSANHDSDRLQGVEVESQMLRH